MKLLLDMIMSIKEMGKEVKQIEIKNRIYYFYNDTIDLQNFNSNLLKID